MVKKAMPLMGSISAQTYPPADLPYVDEISRNISALMVRPILNRVGSAVREVIMKVLSS